MANPRKRRKHEVSLATDRAAYERQPFDTDAGWAAFQVMRGLPPAERNLERAISDAPPGLTSTRNTWEKWSSLNHWRPRLDAWDRAADVALREALLDSQKKIGARTAAQAQDIAAALMVAPTALLMKLKQDGALDALAQQPIEDLIDATARIAKVWPAIVQAERLALGYSTEHLEVTASVEGAPQAVDQGPVRRSRARILELAAAAQDIQGLDVEEEDIVDAEVVE